MKRDAYSLDDVLDQLLQDWHCWCSNFRHVAQSGSCAMFKDAKSSRQWQDSDELHDTAKHNSTMKTINFVITGDKEGKGAMDEPYKTALCFKAKNLVTGVNVWSSPRLPLDPGARALILMTAKSELMARLSAAGVL